MLKTFRPILLALLALSLGAQEVEAATTGTATVSVRVQEQGTADLGTPNMTHLIDYTKSLTSGTSANTADMVWSDQDTVTSGAPDDIDLAGALTAAVGGSSLTLLKPVGLCVVNKSTTTGQYLTVGGDGTAAFYSGLFGAANDTISVQPNGFMCWFSPIDAATVTATTADILQIAAASGTITYQIIVWARSA